ncbi:uncharacterized protein LOC6580320 isoform X3 [Drosophila mojavensis]|uniref:uncharacterized protein LOC6580320 isoform X3 n=1 Tax=Drosophila mojavensis TaxID=7230 RepID=UPI0013EE7B5C|nr:uncharacterized protein LOC6580320 isoform X3 [Drosophila mojavensis]
MANDKADMDTISTTILAIGDETEDSNQEKPEKTLKDLEVEFKNYFSVLLMGNHKPKDEADGTYLLEWFGMESFRRENEPVRFQFYCVGAQKTKPVNANPFHFFQTINAQALMREVRNTLKEERWISRYEMIGPIKGKLNPTRHDEEMYVRRAVYDALIAEMHRESGVLLPYLLHLHRQYAKYNTRR